jgi:hypothetical protein
VEIHGFFAVSDPAEEFIYFFVEIGGIFCGIYFLAAAAADVDHNTLKIAHTTIWKLVVAAFLGANVQSNQKTTHSMYV